MKFARYFQLFLVISLVFYMPLDYGGTSTNSKIILITISCFFLSNTFLMFVFKSELFNKGLVAHRSESIVILALLILYVIPFIPFPPTVVKNLSPYVFEHYNEAKYVLNIPVSAFMPLSFDVMSSRLETMVYLSCLLASLFSMYIFTSRMAYIFCFSTIFVIFAQVFLNYYFKIHHIDFIPDSLVDGHQYRFNGTFINSNHVSAFINILMFLSMVGILTIRKISFSVRVIAIVSSVLFISYYQIQIGSRAGLISPFISLLPLLIFMMLVDKMSIKIITLGLLTFMATILLLIVVFPSREIDVSQLFYTNTLSERLHQWKATLNMIQDYMFFGVGLGNYELSFISYKGDNLSPFRYFHAHNTWLQIIAETGIIASLILFYYIGLVYKRSMSCLFIENITMRDKLVVLVICTGLLNFIIQGSFDSLFVSKAILLLFYIYIAIMGIITKHLARKYNKLV